MRFVNRFHLFLVSLGVAVAFAVVFGSEIVELKKRITKEYFAHKEFVFNLKNASGHQKRVPTEKEVRRILERHRIKVKSIYQSEGTVEVKAEDVEWRFLPVLIRDIEKIYRIKSLSAVDNTGKGYFELRMVVE